jgi:hypothetical protein
MKISFNEDAELVRMKPSYQDNLLLTMNNLCFKNTLADHKQECVEKRASAIFSLLLLLEHRDYWNRKDDFIADWTDTESKKWCITFINERVDIICTYTNKKLLYFRNKESGAQFLETFCNLIHNANDLL